MKTIGEAHDMPESASSGRVVLKFVMGTALLGILLVVFLLTQPRQGPVTVSELAIIPGRREALYVKLRPAKDSMGFPRFTNGSVRGFSWDPEGNVKRKRLCDIFTSGQRQLPTFVMTAPNGPYCFTTFNGGHEAMTSLWQLDPMTMQCCELIQGAPDKRLFCFDRYNILDGRLAAISIDIAPDSSDQSKHVLVSVGTAETELAPDGVRHVRDGMFLLKDRQMVWAGVDIERPNAPGVLCQDGRAIADGVVKLLGITADARRVFFSRQNLAQVGSAPALWSYDVATGELRMLVDWVGDQFKAGIASGNIGFLETEGQSQKDGLPGTTKMVVGARVFSISGELLERVVLPKPTSLRVSAWDVDLMEMVYYDSTSREIVIQRLGGEVIASFTP